MTYKIWLDDYTTLRNAKGFNSDVLAILASFKTRLLTCFDFDQFTFR